MSGKILIVDDEPSGISTLEAMLDGQGYQLLVAQSGTVALDLAERSLPDLILLDVMMPGMDGFEVCRRVREMPILAEVPIIILTALDDYSSRLIGIEAGADDFFSKPLDRQDLRARVRTITRLNRYRTLLEQREQLREMAGRMVDAQEKERRRISRDLHDDLGQSLTALMLNLQNLQNDLPLSDKELRARLGKMVSDTAETLGRMRSMAQDLRPPVMDTLDLRAALENYCMEFSARLHVVLNFEADQNIPVVSDVHSITMYRFLQEALTNVSRHARANRVWVELMVEEDFLSLTVQDNGAGFEATADKYGIGIVGLQERMTLVGGDLFVNSTPGRGTIITARVPLHMEEK
jgi:signal transduction histidine kinase